jgi:sugar phosphate permease
MSRNMSDVPPTIGNATVLHRSDRMSKFRWVVLALICIVYMLVAADRVNLGIAIPAIKQEFHISNTEAGLFATLMFFCFAVAQIPSGYLARRFGARNLMTIALVLTALSSFLVGTSTSPTDIKLYRSLLGLAEASISVCCITTINQWFSSKEKGTASGLFWGASKMGPVICPPLSVLIMQHLGWRAIFQFFAIPVTVLAILWFWKVRNRPEESPSVSQAELDHIRSTDGTKTGKGDRLQAQVQFGWLDRIIRARSISPIETTKSVFLSWNIIGCAFAYLCMVGILNTFLAWIPSYLTNAKHLSLTSVGFLSAVPFAGAVAGNLAGGWISDRLLQARRKPLMMLGAAATTVTTFILIYAPASPIFTAALLLLMGFTLGLGYPQFSIYPMGLTNKDIYPVAYAVVNIGASLGAALFPLAAGIILDGYNWDVLFVFLAGASLLALVFLTTIIEPRNEDQRG